MDQHEENDEEDRDADDIDDNNPYKLPDINKKA